MKSIHFEVKNNHNCPMLMKQIIIIIVSNAFTEEEVHLFTTSKIFLS